jgi:uncharacterized protein involved in response to NO
VYSEPFRLFFPAGIFCLLGGALVWLPQIWTTEFYPVLLHRYLVLNGFTTSFIGGFLMTAVPRFSKTEHAKKWEVWTLFSLILLGAIPAALDHERCLFAVSALQAMTILMFIFRRIFKRKENPPYSFLFIFVGLILWIASALASIFIDSESFKQLHYEGAIAAIILGVGGRLIPGILGHVEIVGKQRENYERPVPLLQTVPKYFFLLIFSFVVSYFLPEMTGGVIRTIVVSFIGFFYWKLYQKPAIKTSLTWSIWMSGWFIVFSFLLRAMWPEGMIHGSHAFFLGGIVLLSLLVATRVIQSHGPKDPKLENWKGLYVVTGLILFAAATRVSAFLLPESYLHHLGYSSFLLVVAVIIWSVKYLKYVRRF